MERLDLQRIGGAAAVVASATLVTFSIVLTAGLGNEALSADEAFEFLPLFAAHKGLGVSFAVVLAVAPLLVAVAGMGIFQMLRQAGSIMWLALFGFVGSGLAVVYRGCIWLAMTLSLAPAYVEADATSRPALEVFGDTLYTFALGADVVGGVLAGGLGVLIFSIGILKTGLAPRWLGWLGLFASITGGWLMVLVPISDTIEAVTLLGAVAFWIWLAALGIVVWRSAVPAGPAMRSLRTADGLAPARET